MFLNVSNHPSDKWQASQIEAAQVYGQIIDYPFPLISARASEADISDLAQKHCKEIIDMKPSACMVAGEFSLTFQLVEGLLSAGIPVFISCSERRTVEKVNPNGTITKVSEFDFVGFRKYEHYIGSDSI